MKTLITTLLLLLSIGSFAQASKYKPEEVKEFYRQAKLTPEYISLKNIADSNNAVDGILPIEIKFIIQQDAVSGPNNERLNNLLKGYVYIRNDLGTTNTSYIMMYDRKKQKIVEIKTSGEVNPKRHSFME